MVVVIEIEVVDWNPLFSRFAVASSLEEAKKNLEGCEGSHYYECYIYSLEGEVLEHLRRTRFKRD